MSKLDQEILQQIELALAPLELELLGTELISQGKHSLLRIYLDHTNGVNAEHCKLASKQIGAILDVADPIKGAYRLEVSSPGLDRPLFKPVHFQKYVGKAIKLRLRLPLEGRKNFQGELKSADEKGFILVADGEEFHFTYGDVDKANLVAKLGS